MEPRRIEGGRDRDGLKEREKEGGREGVRETHTQRRKWKRGGKSRSQTREGRGEINSESFREMTVYFPLIWKCAKFHSAFEFFNNFFLLLFSRILKVGSQGRFVIMQWGEKLSGVI